MGRELPYRPRDPDGTKASILAAARGEFAKAGLSGARVERIAEQSGANKRMIYHYFGSKEQLFAAVVEDAYVGIRGSEALLALDELPPVEAMRRLVEFTWRYYLDNPEFITLVNSENLHQARHIAGSGELRKLQKAHVDVVQRLLDRGVEEGVFRPGVDAAQLCITIAAIGFYYLNNRHTGSELFGFGFATKGALAKRLSFNVETVLRMVAADLDGLPTA